MFVSSPGIEGRAWARPFIIVVSLAVLVLSLFAIARPMTAEAVNPPGNNGTVKLDRVAFDTHPDNQPHVGCIFEVDFYGFDEGDLNAEVLFEIWPPNGPMETLLTDELFIGEDSNAGGGSEAGLDAEREYDLSSTLAPYTPHPKQGWHVKLTVHADGAQGNDTKYKVFWVTGCDAPPSPASS